jgi:hypothetical protein
MAYVEVLGHAELSSAATSIALSSLNNNSALDLFVIAQCRDVYASASSPVWLHMSLNGKTSDDKTHRRYQDASASAGYPSGDTNTNAYFGSLARQHVNAGNYYSCAVGWIIHQNTGGTYNNNWSVWAATMYNGSTTSAQRLDFGTAGYQGTSGMTGEISDMEVWSSSGYNLAAGSTLTVYGTKAS